MEMQGLLKVRVLRSRHPTRPKSGTSQYESKTKNSAFLLVLFYLVPNHYISSIIGTTIKIIRHDKGNELQFIAKVLKTNFNS